MMEAINQFTLKINHKITWRKKLLAVMLAAIPIAIAAYFLITKITVMPFWLPVVIIITAVIGSIVVYLQVAADRNPLHEQILLHCDYVESSHFGKVDFADILYVENQTRRPGNHQLELKLRRGNTLRWTVFGPKVTANDQGALSDFASALHRKHKAYLQEHGKTFPRSYALSYVTPSGFWYALLCLIFIPVLFIPSDIDVFGFWLLPLIFVPFIGGVLLMVIKTMRKDHVSLFKNHLLSKTHGRLDYATIKTIITATNPLSPGLTTVLKNGKKVQYRTLNFGSTDTQRVVDQHRELRHFIRDFVKILEGSSPQKTFDKADAPAQKDRGHKVELDPAENSEKIQAQATVGPKGKNENDVRSHNEGVRHIRQNKGKYIGISIGLVVSVLLIVRTCDFKDHLLQDAADNSRSARQKALRLVETFTKKNGPYLLFTNDAEAKLYSIPEKKTPAKSLLKRLRQHNRKEAVPKKLRETNAGFDFYKEMRYARRHPDSVNWHIAILHKKALVDLGKINLNPSDSVPPRLFIASYTPKVKRHDIPAMRAYRQKKGLPDSTARQLRVVLPVNQNGSLKENLKKHPYTAFPQIVKTLQNYPGTTTVYVVSKTEHNGIHHQRFKALVKDLRAILADHQIDAAGFQVKTVP